MLSSSSSSSSKNWQMQALSLLQGHCQATTLAALSHPLSLQQQQQQQQQTRAGRPQGAVPAAPTTSQRSQKICPLRRCCWKLKRQRTNWNSQQQLTQQQQQMAVCLQRCRQMLLLLLMGMSSVCSSHTAAMVREQGRGVCWPYQQQQQREGLRPDPIQLAAAAAAVAASWKQQQQTVWYPRRHTPITT
jgi:hypothetical protein